MPGFWCAECKAKHRSVYYHTRAIEAQMRVDRKAIVVTRGDVKGLLQTQQAVVRQMRVIYWFTILAVALLAVFVSLR